MMIWSAAPAALMQINTTRPHSGDHLLVNTIVSATAVSSAMLSAIATINSVKPSPIPNSRTKAIPGQINRNQKATMAWIGGPMLPTVTTPIPLAEAMIIIGHQTERFVALPLLVHQPV
jgi:hypothetical protein